MSETIRQRIQEILDERGIAVTAAAKMCGLRREFLQEYLSGKKGTIRPANLQKVADGLGVDVAYLRGQTDVRRRAAPGSFDRTRSVRFAGHIEPGVWRTPNGLNDNGLPVGPDPRFPADNQVAYVMHGTSAEPIGIPDDAILIGIDPGLYETMGGGKIEGVAVVVRRERTTKGNGTERSVRTVRPGLLGMTFAKPDDPADDPIQFPGEKADERVTIEAVVVAALRLYPTPTAA
jgi:transcriptional regulator with XRE-family HTH domain